VEGVSGSLTVEHNGSPTYGEPLNWLVLGHNAFELFRTFQVRHNCTGFDSAQPDADGVGWFALRIHNEGGVEIETSS
jgi:hypothetical protein